MRAVVIGAVESTRIAIECIGRSPGWVLPLVLTLPRDLAHRHSDFVDLVPAAHAAGARLFTAANGNAPESLDAIAAVAPDFVFIIGWSQIAQLPLIAIPAHGTIGYHPAPLPRMRGRAVIPWTILTGEPITGGTLFWIDRGVDSGPILEQGFFHVAADETATTLYARHMQLLGRMMEKALIALLAGNAPRQAQDERFATLAARRTPESGRIDWTQDAGQVDRLVRSVTRPYPGARTGLGANGQDVILWQTRIAAAGHRFLGREGQVVARSADHFTVLCGGGTAIEVTGWEGATPALYMQLGERA